MEAFDPLQLMKDESVLVLDWTTGEWRVGIVIEICDDAVCARTNFMYVGLLNETHHDS